METITNRNDIEKLLRELEWSDECTEFPYAEDATHSYALYTDDEEYQLGDTLPRDAYIEKNCIAELMADA